MLQFSRRQMIKVSCASLISASSVQNINAKQNINAIANPYAKTSLPENSQNSSALDNTKYNKTKLIAAARAQIGVTTGYDGAYKSLSYPNGDIARVTGVCVDVVIRAYRDAFTIDLQQLVHEDMNANFDAYPSLWQLSRPDRNIDHRRVPNLEAFFARQGYEQPIKSTRPNSWEPGDIISMRLQGNLPHIAIISDRKALSGQWLAIHNIGRGAREEDIINRYNKQRRFQYIPTT